MKTITHNTYSHHVVLSLSLFLARGFIRGISVLVISLLKTLIEFLDNCKHANGYQSLWNVKLLKTKAKKADKSRLVVAFLISARIR